MNLTPTRTKSNNKTATRTLMSKSTHTRQDAAWRAGGCEDYPCVIHILTSVFQCEGRIIHVCCGQLSPIRTSEKQTASEQELWYYMCIKNNKNKNKKKKRKKKTQRAWIFAAPEMGFLSSTLYLLVWCTKGLQSAKVNISMYLWVCFRGVYCCHR